MLATYDNPTKRVDTTFLPEFFMAKRGRPPLEKMSIERGEFFLGELRVAVENLEKCLLNMQKRNMDDLPIQWTPLIAKHIPYVAEFCESAANKVSRVAIQRELDGVSEEERQQQRAEDQKKRKPKGDEPKPRKGK
jgi:hypothetical protein